MAWSRSRDHALQPRPSCWPRTGIEAEVVDPRTLRPLDDGHHLRVGAQDQPLRGGRGGLAHAPASAPRSRTACSASASTTSTRRSCASPRRTCRCPTPRRSRRPTCRSRSKVVEAVQQGALPMTSRKRRPGQAVADDGGGHHRQVEQEGGRRDQGRRRAGRDRDRQGQHGDGGPRPRACCARSWSRRAARRRSAR